MGQRQFAQDRAAGPGQADPDLALVPGAGMPGDRACLLQPVYQLHGAVMLDEKALRDLPNRGLHAFRQPVDNQQELMLLRLNSMFPRRSLAEEKELPDLPAELGQIAILAGGEIGSGSHGYIVSRHKWRRRMPGVPRRHG